MTIKKLNSKSPISRMRKIRNAQIAPVSSQAFRNGKPLGYNPTLKHVVQVETVRYKFGKRKTAQAVAFLLRRADKNKLTKGFLVKMLYAADRKQIRLTGFPITGDQPFSLPNGPILGTTLDLLNGKIKDASWQRHFSTANKDTNYIHLLVDMPDDLLTKNEKASLQKAYDVMSKMEWPELIEWCHKNFGEWEDPGRGQQPIYFESIYREVGKPEGFSEEIQEIQKEAVFFQQLLA